MREDTEKIIESLNPKYRKVEWLLGNERGNSPFSKLGTGDVLVFLPDGKIKRGAGLAMVTPTTENDVRSTKHLTKSLGQQGDERIAFKLAFIVNPNIDAINYILEAPGTNRHLETGEMIGPAGKSDMSKIFNQSAFLFVRPNSPEAEIGNFFPDSGELLYRKFPLRKIAVARLERPKPPAPSIALDRFTRELDDLMKSPIRFGLLGKALLFVLVSDDPIHLPNSQLNYYTYEGISTRLENPDFLGRREQTGIRKGLEKALGFSLSTHPKDSDEQYSDYRVIDSRIRDALQIPKI